MASIKTRITSGGGATVMNQPLTNAEIDTNFINLNTDKVEVADCVSTNTANKVVRRDASGNFTAGTISASLSGTATQANNINGGVAGAIPWQSAVNTTGLTAAGSNGQIFRSNGTSVPTWMDQSSIAAGTAATFATARNISIGTGATGTATSFNGSADITIPITAINADYISSGTLSVARLGTTGAPQLGSLGVGTAASGTTGEIRATNNITAYYSDKRLKTEVSKIENALDKIEQLTGVIYTQNKLAETYGYNNYEEQVGLYAQDVKRVQPQAVKPAPFDIAADGSSKSGENFLTVQYEKLVPLLVEGIKELRKEVNELKGNR